MQHRCANNARAMRAVYGRPSANRAVESFLSWCAAFVVAGFAVGITAAVIFVAGMR